MRLTSSEAKVLENCKLIINDEVTMLTKHGIRCIDKLLCEIMKNDKPFGGKVVVIGGDFRQTLPIVPRRSRVDIIEVYIKSSDLWRNFTKLSLTENMLSEGQSDHNNWLLNIVTGNTLNIPNAPINSIKIPKHMITDKDIIDEIYGDDIMNMPIADISKRAILAPINKNTLEINKEIISKLSGQTKVYSSADSIVSDDTNDFNNYTPEFLHELTPSGMPPHNLELKSGVIVMLLRNLNSKKRYV